MLSHYGTLAPWHLSSPLHFEDRFHHLQPSRVEQTENALEFELSVPGFRDDEVQVTIDGNLLKIRAEHSTHDHKETKDESGKVSSRWKSSSWSNVAESFRLPYGLNTDGMSKQIENGVLKVHIPKLAIADRPAQEQQRQIGGGQQFQQQQQQQGQQQQQMMWPPRVTTENGQDGKTLVYTVHLPNVRKEDVRLNIEENKLYLTVAEHYNNHASDSCNDCGTYRQQGKEASLAYDSWQNAREGNDKQLAEDRYRKAQANYENSQCKKFNERSCIINLPFGTRADCVHAKFESNCLILNIDRRPSSSSIRID